MMATRMRDTEFKRSLANSGSWPIAFCNANSFMHTNVFNRMTVIVVSLQMRGMPCPQVSGGDKSRRMGGFCMFRLPGLKIASPSALR